MQVAGNLQNTGLVYYCNWVLGTYSDGTTQTIVSAVGNAPLGFGILIMWPLVGKFGKRKVMLAGTAIAAVSGLAFLANPTNMAYVLVMLIIVFILMLFYKVEDDIPRIHQEVTARHKAEAAAAGKEWFSAEEIAAKEQEEQDRLAEENRLRELREKCEKKGLDFDEKEAKYQAALAAKQAKEAEKAAKKQAKAESKAAGKRKK